jgi:hypothetical protein
MKLTLRFLDFQRRQSNGLSTADLNAARSHSLAFCGLALPPRSLLAGVLLVATLAGCGSDPAKSGAPISGGAASAKKPAGVFNDGGTNKVAVFGSVFHIGPKAGRDPFFPHSDRGAAQTADGIVTAQLPLLSYLKLMGIWPGTTRPMALINRTVLALGEESDVSIVISNQFNKAEVQKVGVRCLEIRRDSVLISIAGEPGVKELRIAQGK